MLVTFSANGTGAATLTDFCRTGLSYSALQPAPQGLHLPRTRKRSRVGMKDTHIFGLPNSKPLFLRTKSEGSQSNRRKRTALHHTESYIFYGDEAHDRDDEKLTRLTPLNLIGSTFADAKSLELAMQRQCQLARELNSASLDRPTLKNQSMREISSGPLLSAPEYSPTTCVDPKVLDKNYVPEHQEGPITTVPLQLPTTIEPYTSPYTSPNRNHWLATPPYLDDSLPSASPPSYSKHEQPIPDILWNRSSWHEGRRGLFFGESHQQRHFTHLHKPQEFMTNKYLRPNSRSRFRLSLKEGETTFERNIISPERKWNGRRAASSEDINSRPCLPNNHCLRSSYHSPYHKIRPRKDHIHYIHCCESESLYIMEELAKDRGLAEVAERDCALHQIVHNEVKDDEHIGNQQPIGSPLASIPERRVDTTVMMGRNPAYIKIQAHTLLLHKFVKGLPAGQPYAPFPTEIFPDSEYDTMSKCKYKNTLAYHATQSVKLRDVGVVSSICYLFTRKYPSSHEHLANMNVQEPAREKRAEDYGMDLAFGLGPFDKEIYWMYTATAKVNGRDERLDVRIPKKLVTLDGVEYQVEPSWDEVVGSLKAEVDCREAGWKWVGEQVYATSLPTWK